MTWGRRWLQALDIDETNPVRLMLFAQRWMRYYVVVVQSLRECVANER
jgi:hypothetical protein